MILNIYIIILLYFLLGGIGFYLINRNKDKKTAQNSLIKYITYFIIINVVYSSIVFNSSAFHYLAILIMVVASIEFIKLFTQTGYAYKGFFMVSSMVYILLCFGFFLFSKLSMETILFSFLVLSIFDAFSQISGQLFGHKHIAPAISPNKTLEGLIGGALAAMAGAFILGKLLDLPVFFDFFIAGGIIVFAFVGDLASSFYKRKYGVKDFTNLLPGHGGFLDRFDSLIAGGAFVAMIIKLLIPNI